MTLTLAAAYAIRAVAVDPGYAVAISRLADTYSDVEREPPRMITASSDGRVLAFVERQPRGGERVVVLRNGHRSVIPRPTASSFLRTHYAAQFGVEKLALGNDNTLFATLGDNFSGAYSGTYRETYVYGSKSWKKIGNPYPYAQSCGSCPENVGIGAAEALDDFALNLDYDAYHPVAGQMFQANPQLFAPSSAIVIDKVITHLGIGQVTAMSGSFATGYIDGFQHRYLGTMATRWSGRRRTILGQGVGFDVDARGTVVGDDRSYWDGPAHPTLWDKGRATRLFPAEGSAFAIRGDIIVGSASGSAFVMSRAGSKSTRHFGRIIRGRWQIVTAFSIATNGSIVALGRYGHGELRIIRLHPVARR